MILEIHVVELPKLPQKNDGTDLYDWIRFIKAKDKEEFEMLAKQSNYLTKAYETLEEISADKQKRMEYDARQKALYDYNTMIIESLERGRAEGRAEGEAKGRAEGEAKGRAEGEAKGRAEKEKELKAQMIADGIDEKIIRKYFGSI